MNDWLSVLIRALVAEGKTTLDGTSLLHLATFFNRMDLVLWLLDQGASPTAQDKRGRTPLFFAADRRMARTLLKAGAAADHQDLFNHTPLHAAVRAGRMDVAHALRKANANLNAQDKRGHTPLHAASIKGRVKCVEYLLRSGANPNVLDRKGRHPLYHAVAAGKLETAIVLMEGGADLEILDEDGTSWITLAKIEQVGALQACATRLLLAESENEWTPLAIVKPPRVSFCLTGNTSQQAEYQSL